MIKTYISIKAHEAIGDACVSRSMEKIIIESNKLYEGLKQDLKKVIAGEEDVVITRVIDRKIGKSYSIIRLSIEYNLPIVVRSGLEKFYQGDAQEFFNRSVKIIPLNQRAIEREKNIDIVLKDQDTTLEDIIDKFKPREVKVIGFSSIFKD